MEPQNLDNLIEKVQTIAHGPHADLLEKFIDLLYAREMEEEYFSPEDEVAIAEGKAQIARGEYVTLEELKRELGL
jgi:predicted transcriptional regulator